MPENQDQNNFNPQTPPAKYGISEDVHEALEQKNVPDVQKNLMNQPAFQKPAPVAAAPVYQNTPAPLSVPLQPVATNLVQTPQAKKTVKKKSSAIAWIFGTVFMFLILGGMWILTYLLTSDGGALFKQFGVNPSDFVMIAQGIYGGYGFMALILILVLLISAASFFGGTPKKGKKRKGGAGMVFSLIFFLITSGSFLASFSKLSKLEAQDAAQSVDLADYIKYTPDPATGSAPFQVTFDASRLEELQPNSFYTWDFGDASDQGVGPKIKHTYEEVGVHKVSLFISDGLVEPQEVPREIIVVVNNAKATPRISADVLEGEAPLKVNFDASTSDDPNGTIEEYQWSFGDEKAERNFALGVESIHTFQEPGTYDVVLELVDNNGESVSQVQSILVTEIVPGLEAKFLASETSGRAPLIVQFNASGSNHPDADIRIVSYSWNFGDGSLEKTNKILKHTFTDPGTYLVALTVTDSEGEEALETTEIEVLEETTITPLSIVTTPAALSGKAPLEMKFETDIDASTSDIVQYTWVIDELEEEFLQKDFMYSFDVPGIYTVIASVENGEGTITTDSITVEVTTADPTGPEAIMTTSPDPAQGIRPLDVEFDASDSIDADGNIIAYKWDFGNGQGDVQSTSPKINHRFDKIGLHTVTLTVVDNEGQENMTERIVSVGSSKPKAQINTNTLSVKTTDPVIFTAAKSTGNIASYNWNFGDGTSDKGLETTHRFKSAGTYEIKLTVIDTLQISDYDTLTVEVTE